MPQMKGTSHTVEELIRLEAYLLSEKAGHPHDMERKFWVQAEAIVHGRTKAAAPGAAAKATKKVAAKPAAATKASAKAPAAKKATAPAATKGEKHLPLVSVAPTLAPAKPAAQKAKKATVIPLLKAKAPAKSAPKAK